MANNPNVLFQNKGLPPTPGLGATPSLKPPRRLRTIPTPPVKQTGSTDEQLQNNIAQQLKLSNLRLQLQQMGVKQAQATDDRNFLQRALNLPEHTGFFGDVMDLLGRLGQGVKGFLAAASRPGQLPTGDTRNPFLNFINGVAGKVRITGAGLLQDMFGWQIKNPFLKFVVNFGVDFATDPLMWFNAPWEIAGKGVLLGAKWLSKGVESVLSSYKTGEKFLDGLTTLSAKFAAKQKKLFGTYKDLKFLDTKGAIQSKNVSMLSAANNAQVFLGKVQNDLIPNFTRKLLAENTPEASKLKATLTGTPNPTAEQLRAHLTQEVYHRMEGDQQYSSAGIIQRTINNAERDASGKIVGDGVVNAPFLKRGLTDDLAKMRAKGVKGNDLELLSKIKNKNVQQFTKELDILNDNLKELLPELKNEDLYQVRVSGNGVFLNLAKNTVQTINKRLPTLSRMRQLVRDFGARNDILRVMEEITSRGATTMNMNDPLQRHLLEQLQSLSGKKFKVQEITELGPAKRVSVPPFVFQRFLRNKNSTDFLNYLDTTFGTEADRQSVDAVQASQNSYNTLVRHFNKWLTAPLKKTPATPRSLAEYLFKVPAGRKVARITDYTTKGVVNKYLTTYLKDVLKIDPVVVKKLATGKGTYDKLLDKLNLKNPNQRELLKSFQRRALETSDWLSTNQRQVLTGLQREVRKAEVVTSFRIVPVNKTAERGLSALRQEFAFAKRWTDPTRKDFTVFKSPDIRSRCAIYNTHMQSIVNTLTDVKNQVYNVADEWGDKVITDSAKYLNIDGYMRHIITPQALEWKALKQLKDTKRFRRGMQIFNQGKSPKEILFERRWLGSSKDINAQTRFLSDDQYDLLKTDPIEAIGSLWRLVPQQFMAQHLFHVGIESGFLREMPTEVTDGIINRIEELKEVARQEGRTPLEKEVRRRYQKVTREVLNKNGFKEYELVSDDVLNRLRNSLEWIREGGANDSDLKALDDQLVAFDNRGIIHSGYKEQILKFSRQLKTQNFLGTMNVISKVTRGWKQLALLSVGYHLRNFSVNVLNAVMSGIPIEKYVLRMREAVTTTLRYSNKVLPVISDLSEKGVFNMVKDTVARNDIIRAELDKLGLTDTWNKVLEWHREGLIGPNRFNMNYYDLMSDANKIFDKVALKPRKVNVLGRVMRQSMHLTKFSDDASRIAAYEFAKTPKGVELMKKLKTKTPTDFAKRVFFDYNDQTVFEQRYMRALVPFYIWARKNISLQIANMMRLPARYYRTVKLFQDFQSSVIDPKLLTKYDKENLVMPIPSLFGRSDHTTFIKVNWSFLDIPQLLHPSNDLERLNPFLKTLLEQVTGRDFFRQKDIKGSYFQTFSKEFLFDTEGLKSFLDMTKPTSKSHLGLVGLRLNNALEPWAKLFGLKGGVTGAGDLLPSFFRTQSNLQLQSYQQQQLIQEINEYLQMMRQRGVYVPSLSAILNPLNLPQPSRWLPHLNTNI